MKMLRQPDSLRSTEPPWSLLSLGAFWIALSWAASCSTSNGTHGPTPELPTCRLEAVSGPCPVGKRA